jgi:hypothetical protein
MYDKLITALLDKIPPVDPAWDGQTFSNYFAALDHITSLAERLLAAVRPEAAPEVAVQKLKTGPGPAADGVEETGLQDPVPHGDSSEPIPIGTSTAVPALTPATNRSTLYRIPDDMIAQWARWHAEGVSLQEIAVRSEVAVSTVARRLREFRKREAPAALPAGFPENGKGDNGNYGYRD